jgi:type I restriction enzyme S subunit
MNPAQLLSYFDRISDAPEAIPRLRRFILDLAVRGKLVEADPNDEPAGDLLARCQLEKLLLVRTGKIRTPRPVPANDDQAELFSIPPRWVWCRLSDVGVIVAGGTPPSADQDNFTTGGSGIAWLTPADLGRHRGLYVSYGARDLTPQGLHSSSATLMPKGSVLFTSRAPIGYTAIAANEMSTNQGFKSVVPFLAGCNLYIAVYFRAFGKWIDSKASGTTFREVSGKTVAALPFPLPPLVEQHRIVAKVDELMALCDRLEAVRLDRESRRDRVTAASLYRLNQPTDVATFREYANFYLRHLARVATRPDQVPALRQTILSLAVRGQLVPQDSSAESTKRIFQRSDSSGSDAESLASMALPTGWRIAPLAEITAAIVDCPHSTPKWTDFGKFCVRTNQFRPGLLDLTGVRFVSEATYTERIERLRPTVDDILYSREGGILGVACRVPPNIELCLGQRMMLIRAGDAVAPPFLEMVLNSPFITEIARSKTTGGAAPRVNVATVKAYPIPVPPMSEQHRIVAKVKELMALCDGLEDQLTTAQTASRRLLEAVLHHALARAS